jgi:hypothetical protein
MGGTCSSNGLAKNCAVELSKTHLSGDVTIDSKATENDNIKIILYVSTMSTELDTQTTLAAIFQLLVTRRLGGQYQLDSTDCIHMKCYAQLAVLSYCSHIITLSCVV